MQGQTESDPLLYWGTNKQGGTGDHYAGRVHVVWHGNERKALCGLPIEEVWEQRPPRPDNLCPLCCVRAMAALFPAFTESLLGASSEPGRHELVVDDRALGPEGATERTFVNSTVVIEDSLA